MKVIFKTFYASISLLLFAISCGQHEEFFIRFPEFNDKFSSTITGDNYDAVYEIIKEEFEDFPEEGRRTINYELETEVFYLNILLKKKKIRIAYSSNEENSSNEVTDKIARIKERVRELED